MVTGTAPGIVQAPQQLQTTAAPGTWIPQQAENTVAGIFNETLFCGEELKISLCFRQYLLLLCEVYSFHGAFAEL